MSSKSLKISLFSLALVLPALCLIPAIVVSQAIALQDAGQDRAQPPEPAAKPADKPPQEEQTSPQQEYQALLERVKKSDASVDFKRMRELQTRLDNYAPYGAGLEDEHPLAALAAGEVARAQALAEGILAQGYLDLEAHFAAAQVADKRGDAAAAAHHRYVLQGVLDSILKSGDGKTPETAFVVIAISEEYAVMHHLGLKVAGQGLISDDEGHSYDLLHGVDPATQAAREVFFNIDAIMGALDKKLSQ
jgi:hypothetical protein